MVIRYFFSMEILVRWSALVPSWQQMKLEIWCRWVHPYKTITKLIVHSILFLVFVLRCIRAKFSSMFVHNVYILPFSRVYGSAPNTRRLDPDLNIGWGWCDVKPISAYQNNIFTDRSKAVLLLWIICVIYFLCLSCFHVCWPPEGKGLTSWLLFVMLIVICYFPIWYPPTGVVLDCIDSWSLLSFLLSLSSCIRCVC